METKKVGIVKRLIPPEMIPAWIPGQQTVDSSHLAWDGLTLKGYNYASQQASIPAMRDYMIVIYRGGRSMMRRRSGGEWKTSTVEQGVITFVTRCEESEWHWTNPIDVRHIYLGHDALLKTAEEVFEHDFSRIQIDDIVGSKDHEFAVYLDLLEMELNNQGIGDTLFIDAFVLSCVSTLCANTPESLSGKFQKTGFHEIRRRLFWTILHAIWIKP